MVIISSDKKRWFHSVRWRFFIIFGLTSLGTLAFFFNTMIVAMRNYYQKDLEDKLSISASMIAGSIRNAEYLTDASKRSLFDLEIQNKSREGAFRILVIDAGGYVINDSNMTETGKTYLVPEAVEALHKGSKTTTHPSEKAVYAASSITDETSNKMGVVLIVASSEDIYESLADIEQKLFLLMALAILIVSVVTFFMSRVIINPLNNILKVVQKMSEGHLNERIAVKGYDEFSELGTAFNDMAESLAHVDKIREEFVSNVSHELKTPLSSIKVLSQSILLQENVPAETYTEFLEDINSEVDRMTNIINDLLTLVKLDQLELALNIKPTDLNKIVADTLKRMSPLAEHKHIELFCEDVRSVKLDADEVKLGLAISNLVENGIKYTPDGGMVRVVVDADHQFAYLTVRDTGIGISEENHTKIFNRFYRVDKTRDRETGGTGLGLSITRSTVLMHKGSIRVISKEGEGSTFVVKIPLRHTYASDGSEDSNDSAGEKNDVGDVASVDESGVDTDV